MRLRIRRLGGIAGIPLRAELDTEQLPAPESGRVEAAVRRLAGHTPAAPPQPDRFRYEITAPDQPGLAPIVLDEREVPDQLAGVIRAAVETGELERPQR